MAPLDLVCPALFPVDLYLSPVPCIPSAAIFLQSISQTDCFTFLGLVDTAPVSQIAHHFLTLDTSPNFGWYISLKVYILNVLSLQTLSVVSHPQLWVNWSVLVGPCISSLGLLNEVSQTGWFKAAELYSLTALEARSPALRCWEGWLLLEDSDGESLFYACP